MRDQANRSSSVSQVPTALSPESARIDWVDTARGLGLLLVIFGHMLYSGAGTCGGVYGKQY